MTCQPAGPSRFEAVHGTLHLPQRGLGAVEGKKEQADSNSNHPQAMHSIAAHTCRSGAWPQPQNSQPATGACLREVPGLHGAARWRRLSGCARRECLEGWEPHLLLLLLLLVVVMMLVLVVRDVWLCRLLQPCAAGVRWHLLLVTGHRHAEGLRVI